MAGSYMRLVRLKPQGPGPNRGPDRPVQKKIIQRKFAVLLNFNQDARNFVCGWGSAPDLVVGGGAHIAPTPSPLSREGRGRKGR